MLATLLIWLSVAVAVLALLDLFLSKAQKTWLSNVVIKAWNILDEARRWSFLDWLKNPRARWWLALSLALVLGLVFNVWQIFLLESSEGFFLLTVAVISISFVIFDVYRLRCKLDDYLLRFTLPKDLLLKLVIRSLGMGGAYALALIAAYYGYHYLPAMTDLPTFPLGVVVGVVAGVVVSFIGLLLATAVIISSLLLVFTIMLAIVLAYIASGLLFVAEFIVRRIAEYPKGPVLAVSAFFGGIIALIKAFG